MSERQERFTSTTPKGEFRFPKLNKYDEYKGAKKYKVDLVLEEDETATLLESLEPVIEQAKELAEEEFAKLKPAQRKKFGGEYSWNDIGTEEYDEDEAETGRTIFKFKTNAYTQQGKLKKVAMFSPRGARLKNVQVWGGTIGKVGFSASPYFNNTNGQAGVTFYLNAVQILELVSGGKGATAEAHGFGEEEGYNDIEDGEEEAADTDGADDSDTDDDGDSGGSDNPDF